MKDWETQVTSNYLANLFFSEDAMKVSIRPIFNTKGKQNKENYRPINVFELGFKMKNLNGNLLSYIVTCVSDFISAYRKKHR